MAAILAEAISQTNQIKRVLDPLFSYSPFFMTQCHLVHIHTERERKLFK
jgi:hypothetical protein